MYSIVETIEKKGTQVTAVPNSWIKKDEKILLWPPKNVADATKLRKFRQNNEPPQTCWLKCPFNRILFENIGTYYFKILFKF